jgi:hypothetical protein
LRAIAFSGALEPYLPPAAHVGAGAHAYRGDVELSFFFAGKSLFAALGE